MFMKNALGSQRLKGEGIRMLYEECNRSFITSYSDNHNHSLTQEKKALVNAHKRCKEAYAKSMQTCLSKGLNVEESILSNAHSASVSTSTQSIRYSEYAQEKEAVETELNIMYSEYRVKRLHQIHKNGLKIDISLDSQLSDIDSLVTVIHIGDYCCKYAKSLSLSHCSHLEELSIGDHSCESINSFEITKLENLRSITIGTSSFCDSKPSDSKKSFKVKNCSSLRSIHIGCNSFQYYGEEFSLSDLPKLKTLQFGKLMRSSKNFYDCKRCKIEGIF